jgi:hypothetical protein
MIHVVEYSGDYIEGHPAYWGDCSCGWKSSTQSRLVDVIGRGQNHGEDAASRGEDWDRLADLVKAAPRLH